MIYLKRTAPQENKSKINKLKQHTAPGIDNITVDYIKIIKVNYQALSVSW